MQRRGSIVTDSPALPILIRDLRKQLGLSQEQLARQLGISFQTVNRWENGRSIPSQMAMKLLKKLLKDMSIPNQDLWEPYLSSPNPETPKC